MRIEGTFRLASAFAKASTN